MPSLHHVESKSLDAINLYRKSLGLRPIEEGMRNCMCCSKSFYSTDIIKNRMCKTCRHSPEHRGIPLHTLSLR